MSDDQLPETPPPATPPAAVAQQPAAAAITPEVQALITAEAERVRNATWAEARRTIAGKKSTSTATPSNASIPIPQAPPAADDVTSILALRDAFDDVAGDLPIKSSQRSLMREAVMRDRPADMGAYVNRYVERAGWSTAAPAAPQPAVPVSPSVPATPAVPSTLRAPPPPTPVVTDSTPILSMSDTDRERLVERIGIDEFNKRLMPELARTRVRIAQ
jgi:hypothetical protein